MADYKKQHYIPKAYLKKFANEKGEIVRIDKSFKRVVPYKTQNQKDNYYASVNREKFEDFLSSIESQFAKLRKEIDYGTNEESFKTSLQKLSLIFAMLHLYARLQPSKENHLGIQGGPINGFNTEESTTLGNIVSKQKAALSLLLNPAQDNIQLRFDDKEEELYNGTLILTVGQVKTDTPVLITSDNPMSFFTDSVSGEIIGYLPTSPNDGLLIYNKQKFTHIPNLTRTGAKLLNHVQMLNAGSCIFTNPNDKKSNSLEFDLAQNENSGFTSVRDKLFDARISIQKNLDFVLNKNDKPLNMLSYTEAQQKLNVVVLVDYKQKRFEIREDIDLDQFYCVVRLAEIKKHLLENTTFDQRL